MRVNTFTMRHLLREAAIIARTSPAGTRGAAIRAFGRNRLARIDAVCVLTARNRRATR